MACRQLKQCIRYLRNQVTAAKLLGGISDQVLLELSAKYLEELLAIKKKEVDNATNNTNPS